MVPLDRLTFRRWLDEYAAAWEDGDADAAADLFAEDAVYYETPFGDPLEGREAIRRYWAAGAGESQRDVDVETTLLALGRDHGVARFRAAFVRQPSGESVSLDGVLVARFLRGTCVEFREWWDSRDSDGR